LLLAQVTATQLYQKRKQERNAARDMEDEARRLEEQAALQAQRRQEVDADAAAERSTQLAEMEPEPELEEVEVEEADDGAHEDPVANAMRRKVDRERDAAARQIQLAHTSRSG
jgi:hypothetical protein